MSGSIESRVPARRIDSFSAPPVLTPEEEYSLLKASTNCWRCMGRVVTAPVEYCGICVVSFYIQMNENRYVSTSAGFAIGIAMRKNIFHGPAPSIFAASSMAFG